MPLFNWSDRFATTIPVVDQQHRRLFDLINDLHEAMKLGKGTEVMNKTMQGLQEYTQTHFRDEEATLQKAGYPDLAAHQKVHRTFEAKLAELARGQKSGQVGAALDTSRFLSDWLQKHIIETDMKYVPWVTGQRKAA